MWFEVLLLLLLVFAYVYWYVTKNFGFFKKLGVPEEPGTFPFGSDHSWKAWTGKISGIKTYEVEEFMDEKYFGFYMFGQRQFVVTDPEMGKLIAIKDAEYFTDRITFGLSHKDSKEEVDKLFGLFLTNMGGESWKKMRTLSSPVFTSGKLKLMVPHVNKCALNMRKFLEVSASSGDILDAKDMFGKFALDSIATSGFGIESNSFEDPENIFRLNAMKLVRDPKYASMFDIPKFLVMAAWPKLAKLLGITFLDKKITEFFMNIVRTTMENRRKTGTKRNDIIDLFMDELEKDHSSSVFSKEELELGFVATAILFFFAGFDTTSTTLSIVVHALVHHPHIQERLRREIEEVVGDSDEVTADHLKELKYIENIIFESMRKYFSFGISRVCTKDYKLPGTDIVIPKDLVVIVKPKEEGCFANPAEFDPDNFNESDGLNKFAFVGFGQGPRNCIGMRYAIQTLKLAIIHTVRNYNLVQCQDTVPEDKLMFSFSKNGFVGGIKFKVEKI